MWFQSVPWSCSPNYIVLVNYDSGLSFIGLELDIATLKLKHERFIQDVLWINQSARLVDFVCSFVNQNNLINLFLGSGGVHDIIWLKLKLCSFFATHCMKHWNSIEHILVSNARKWGLSAWSWCMIRIGSNLILS